MVMKKRVVVAGGGDLDNLLTLAETATTVGACRVCCGFCTHTDLDACYSTVTKRKAFLETQLFLHRSIGKSSTKRPRRHLHRNPLRRRPLPPSAASADDLIGVKPEPLAVVPSATASESTGMRKKITFTASESTGMRKKITLVFRIQKRPEEEFPRTLRDKVYQTVGEGSTISLVIRKKLTRTDLNEHHNRLSIPLTKIAREFLTDEEKTRLSKPADHHKIRIEVFLDSDMEKVTEDVYLTTWQQGKRYMYYLVGKGWINLAKRQNLIEGDEVELWSFRSLTGSLCFVLVTVEARTAAAVADKELSQ